jgi:hypothetical protein
MKIPRTGRISRFAKILEKEVDEETLRSIMQDSDVYASFKPDQKADWWKATIDRLENSIGEQEAIEVM